MLEIRHLVKCFGPLVAVDDVSFSVPQGEVLGFLGPNGAGKSTTMKMITGFLAPTAGTAVICGFDIGTRPIAAKKHIGYLPEGAPAYPDMTPADFLDFIAHIRGFSGAEAKRRIARVVEMIRIAGVHASADRDLVQGFQAPCRRGAGIAARPRCADPRRADRRARPQPEIRNAQDHRGDAARQGDHHLDASARGGRGGVQPRDHHRARPRARRRHAGRARPSARATTMPSVSASPAAPIRTSGPSWRRCPG